MRRERLREMESRVLFGNIKFENANALTKQPSGDVQYRAKYQSVTYLL